MNNVGWVEKEKLCHGCGACLVVCPHNAISMVNHGEINFPQIGESCTDCGLCNKVCSGQRFSVGLEGFSPESGFFEGNIYLANSLDPVIHEHGSSGGFVTQYLLWLLNAGHISGAIVATSDGTVDGTSAIIASSESEIMQAIGSKYFPVSSCAALKGVVNGGRYAFVGKGCDIESLCLLQGQKSHLSESIIVTIGILCHHTPFARATEKLISCSGFGGSQKVKVTYRSTGWPGKTVVESDGRRFGLDYKDSWGQILGAEDCMPFRCSLCMANFADKADLVVGDPWALNPKLENREGGTSLVLVRSRLVDKHLDSMEKDKVIHLESVSGTLLFNSQIPLFSKVERVAYRLFFAALLKLLPSACFSDGRFQFIKKLGAFVRCRGVSFRKLLSAVKFHFCFRR